MKNFRISTQTAPWYNEKEPFESLQFIKECGFDAIDLSLKNFFLEEYNVENLTSFYDNGIDAVIDHYRPLKEAAEKLDVEIFQAHSHFPVYVKNNPKETEYLLKVAQMMIEVCDFLNCRNIVIHPFYNVLWEEFSYEEEREINLSIYRRLMPFAKKHNVTICLENLIRSFGGNYYDASCSDADEAIEYIDLLNREAGEEIFGLCLDIGHLQAAHREPYKYITKLGNRIKCLHLHENDTTNDAHQIPFTRCDASGYKPVAQWDKILRGLKEVGYSGSINFEAFLGIKWFPEEVRPFALKTLSAVGNYFAKKINE